MAPENVSLRPASCRAFLDLDRHHLEVGETGPLAESGQAQPGNHALAVERFGCVRAGVRDIRLMGREVRKEADVRRGSP